MRFQTLIATVLAVLATTPSGSRAEPLTIFAAASTAPVLEELNAVWTEKSGAKFRLVAASSGTLARQIEAGAPADVFLSANPEWIDYLAGKAAIRPETRAVLFANRLVLIAPDKSDATDAIDPASGTYAALGPGSRGGRIALADPRHVPAGLYAKEALTNLGLWQATEPRAAFAQNVRLTLALVERRAAALGIVYATDAQASPLVRVVASFPATLHAPIAYVAVATIRSGPSALAILRFLQSPPARAIYRAHGFAGTD